MDLHRILLKGNQKANMSPYIPQSCSAEIFPLPQFSQTTGFHGFNNDYRQFPFQSFSCPNSFTSFNFSPEKFINKAVDFTQGMQRLDNLPTMNLTYIVGGFVDGKQGVWNSTAPSRYSNPIENMLNQIVSKSVEITRTMSCPDTFNLHDFNLAKEIRKKENIQLDKKSTNSTPAKMSYADVAKMNLSKPNKNNIFSCKPSSSTHLSSHKPNCPPCSRKETKVSLSHQSYKPVNKNCFRSYRSGTINNITRSDKESGRAKFNHPVKSSNTRRFQVKRPHASLKRELGTKRNNQKVDFDGSVWGRDNMEVDMCEDSKVVHTPGPPCLLVRMRSGSSESDCSSEVSDYLKNPRVRSLSECSVNSIDSEDSFIIFDECSEDRKEDDSYEESSSDESDECSSGYSSSNGVVVYAQAGDFIDCVNSKWDSNHCGLNSNYLPHVPDAENSCSPHSSCAVTNALKKVRFACGEALTQVRKLCVWDYAHRAARIGPWEQAARDRDRFAKRIASLAPILNPILDSAHRKKTYDDRFAPR